MSACCVTFQPPRQAVDGTCLVLFASPLSEITLNAKLVENYSSNGAGMITVGACEAKTHLSALLDKFAAGEEVVITRHGKAVARLIPAEDADRGDVNAVIARLKTLRAGTVLGADWKRLRDEGRR
jgi:prevent-host-death family protein